MDINIISKTLFIGFLLSFNLVESTKTLGFTKGYEVHINNLPGSNPLLLVHCASKNDEIINGTIPWKTEIHWSFHMNFGYTMMYFYHFWWGSKNKAFEVFNSMHHGNICRWTVQQHGFYLFSNFNPVGPQKRKDW
ncbi:hypothetical protein CDL12_09366 [Handroanthus impetiginosus]|uniref:S-protein homolog n=1 Tax=Handroanthus impetiginosus TaxID=429701 RepID=A0A2G9HKA8_9LAMI|nr:hypothetical protein CDL12_09366 [Handroanthus impetiginosus]